MPASVAREAAFGPWRALAACRGLDPALFYPVETSDEAAEPAKRVCADCPVREDCLGYALSIRESEGIWGGLTEAERRRLLRRGR